MPAEMTGPYTDTGTGTYPNPPTEVTVESPADNSSTGAFPAPPTEVTVESPPDHLAGPTGAYPNPPAEVTVYSWPAEAPAETETKAVTGAEAGVENKAVTAAEPVVEDKTPDLEAMTKAELVDHAATQGVETTTRMTKAELIEAIQAAR
jgi:Rho termination factor, N-terminal domain